MHFRAKKRCVARYGRPLVRYQKKEEGSKNVNPTKLERFLDKIKFLYKIC